MLEERGVPPGIRADARSRWRISRIADDRLAHSGVQFGFTAPTLPHDVRRWQRQGKRKAVAFIHLEEVEVAVPCTECRKPMPAHVDIG